MIWQSRSTVLSALASS